MGIAVLGPLQVDGQDNGLSPRDRVVLSAMVARAGEAISTESLADALWQDRPPATWSKVVQGCVMRLRRRLGAAAIESGAFGYRLALREDELDHRLFERLLGRARDALAGGDPARSSYLVKEALDLWRGRALVDVEDWDPGRVEGERLEGLRLEAEELRVEAEIASGHAQSVLEPARSLVARAPFRERRWALLALALYQAGRQSEALGALKRARAMLVDELGLDPGRELVELEQQLLRQDPALAPAVGAVASLVCPYRGLLPYAEADSDSFFGREADIAACLKRLRDAGVLTVIGPSGIGKSSLVRAGVVAALVRDGTPVLVTRPGPHPTDSLALLTPGGRQVLVVDQAEEAVTVCTDTAERERYFSALAAHVHAGGALVLTLRADHLGVLAAYPEIARIVEEGLYLVGAMSEPALRSAIEGPARRSGLRLEEGLVDLLVRDVEGEPAALPLLSHVLRETWERREGPTLTVSGYRSTGGIRNAVSQSAETLYDAMDEAQRGRLRSLLLRLVMPSEDGDPVRARVPRAKVAVDDEHAHLVEQLVEARLVSIDGEAVQIAHEALVKVWPRLRGWLDDDVDGLRLFRHLAATAEAWSAMGRPDTELYRGARLGRTLEWRERTAPQLTDTETAFIAASVALWETERRAAEERITEERRVKVRLRTAFGGVGVLLVVALVAGVVAVQTADRARRDRTSAALAADLADARKAGAQAMVSDDPAASLLLAVAAVRFDSSPETWDTLGAALTRTPTLVGVRDVGGSVVSMAASGDGALLAASLPGEGEGVQLLDATSLDPVPFQDDTAASAVTFSPAGTLMAVAVNSWTTGGPPRLDARPLRLYDVPGLTRSSRQLGGLPPGSAVEYSLGFNQSGTHIAAVAQKFDEELGDWSDRAEALVWELAEPSTPVLRVSVPRFAVATLSPDARSLYVATRGARPVRVYDLSTGELLRSTGTALIRQAGASASAITPDGSELAVASAGVIYRFDTATLEPGGGPLRGHTRGIRDVEYSHDGALLLSASEDTTGIVWDAASGDPLVELAGHQAELWGAAFGSDDRTAYTSSGDGRVMAWSLAGQRSVLATGSLRPAGNEWDDLSLPSPDGQTIARARGGSIWFVDPRTGHRTKPSRTRFVDYNYDYAWSPDSRWLVAGGSDGLLKLWDSRSGRLVGTQQFRAASNLIAAFAPTSEEIYVEADDGQLVTLDRVTLTEVHPPVVIEGNVTELVPHPRDGSVLVLRDDGSFLRVEPATARTLMRAPAGTLDIEGQTIVFSPRGSLVAASHPNGFVRLLDVDSLDWVGEDTPIPWGGQVTYAHDGSQFASVEGNRIRLWDGRNGDYHGSIPLPSTPRPVLIAYLPDSTRLLAASVDGRTWTVHTRTSTWVDQACDIAGRNLAQWEWRRFFPNRAYQETCPRWPPGT